MPIYNHLNVILATKYHFCYYIIIWRMNFSIYYLFLNFHTLRLLACLLHKFYLLMCVIYFST